MDAAPVEIECSSTALVTSQDVASSSTTSPTRATISTTPIITKKTPWQRRDIASLKTQEELEAKCQDVTLWSGATGHPCIIMDLAPNGSHALVTAVSSFRSGPHNNYLPPWKQSWHQGKDPDWFRSFAGTEQHSGSSRNLLYLEGGRQFPKPRTAWVYAGWVHLVPIGALKPFKTADKCELRLEMQSWIDLTLESRQGSPPFSAPASPPRSSHLYQQSPRPAHSGTPTTSQKFVPAAPVNYAQYENVAGNITNELRYQQIYQMASISQLHQQQSFATWSQYAQAQQGCSRYPYQYQHQYQQAPVMHASQHQQQHTGSYMAGTRAFMHNTYVRY
ncbi:hypothetical protein PG993_007286 [Apiospora rasikravindrae]|uniref:Uncharacterized protein n=1 Tax=Apiospora rasikravindrae TaxID=990691 RepID=A0ABR1SX39_9PEZI